MRALRRTLLILVIAVCGLSVPCAQACPGCKEAIDSQTGEGAKLKNGYYYSILFMMAMPFTLLGTGAFLVTRAIRKGGFPEM